MKMFLFFLKTLLYGWIVALVELWRLLCRLLKQWCGRRAQAQDPLATPLRSHQ